MTEKCKLSELDEHLVYCLEENCIIRDKQKEDWKIICNELEYIK